MKIIKVDPVTRLNVSAEHPHRLPATPQYHCPDCHHITPFPLPAQHPPRLFEDQIQKLFDTATNRANQYYPAIADGRCQKCGHCFRVIADYDELHMAHFVYDVIALLELVDEPMTPLQEIETLRRQLETIKHQIGSASDYLDRHHPSPMEAKKAQDYITQQQNVAANLEAQLITKVTTYRKHQPALIQQWANIHQAIFHELNTYLQTHQNEDPYAYRLEQHATAQAIAAWTQVQSGTQHFVIHNKHLIDKKPAITQKHFGF